MTGPDYDTRDQEGADKPPLKLTGMDGNAFAILGRAHQALRKAGMADRIPAYDAEAMAGNYDNLLVVTMDWFEVS
jgi:hypothetical protein